MVALADRRGLILAHLCSCLCAGLGFACRHRSCYALHKWRRAEPTRQQQARHGKAGIALAFSDVCVCSCVRLCVSLSVFLFVCLSVGLCVCACVCVCVSVCSSRLRCSENATSSI